MKSPLLFVLCSGFLFCKPTRSTQVTGDSPSLSEEAHSDTQKIESDIQILVPVPPLPAISDLERISRHPTPCVSYSAKAKDKLVQLAEKVQSLATGHTDDEKEALITEMIFQLKGEDLFLFKNLLEQNKYDLVKILFEDIDDEEFRNKIILHLSNNSFPTKEIRIISDIDDTVAPWQNDPRFPKGVKTHIPGIVSLYQELDCNQQSQVFLGDLTFISARPGIFAKQALDKLEGLGFDHFGVVESQIENLLSVDMLYNWEVNPEKIATNKLKNLRRFLMVYPDYSQLILFGDSGQGDVSFFRQAIAEFPNKIALAIVHDVKPDANSLDVKNSLEKKGIYFVRNYAQGAKILQNRNMISAESFLKIKTNTLDEIQRYPGLDESVKKILLQNTSAVK